MFYTFYQNNSGGYFIEDQKYGIGPIVIFEANTEKEAKKRLKQMEIFIPELFFWCGCCGPRWDDISKGILTPLVYEEDVHNVTANSFYQNAFIHYKDGSIEKINFK